MYQCKIRTEKTSDILKIKEINDLAFGGDSEGKLIESIRNPNILSQNYPW
jgi:predicted N-acetyltransferase YhbS